MRCKITNVKISKKYQGYDQRRLGVEISSVSFYDIVIDGHFSFFMRFFAQFTLRFEKYVIFSTKVLYGYPAAQHLMVVLSKEKVAKQFIAELFL